MDSNLKAIPLTTGTGAGGIAIDPKGNVWVTDKRLKPTGRNGQVFSIAPDGSKFDTYTLPDVPDGRKPRPEYIALQTSGTTVDAVWVSDNAAGVVYRLQPGHMAANDVTMIDIDEHSKLRGLAWDPEKKLIWVADEGKHQLLAIDPNTNASDDTYKTSRPGSAIAMVAVTPKGVTPQGVWFTEFGTGKVSFLDVNTKDVKHSFDFGLYNSEATPRAISYPYGLAVYGKRLWITAMGPGELWSIDDISKPEKPHWVASLGDNSSPREITVDETGYLWISLPGVHKVAELTDTAVPVKEFDVDANGVPGGIAFAPGRDEIWISDEVEKNNRAILLTPLDKIGPAKDGKIAVSAQPHTGNASKGGKFDDWKVIVTEDKKPVEWLVTLWIEPDSLASFDGKSSIDVTTDKTHGDFLIQSLKAAADAADGAQFQIMATARALKAPVAIYTGHIGEAITDIIVLEDKEDSTKINTVFSKVLKAQVQGAGGVGVAGAPVVFKITDGMDKAVIKENEKDEYSTPADSTGIARILLQALDVPGKVVVKAHAAANAAKEVPFADRTVVPIPDNIDPDPDDEHGDGTSMTIAINRPSSLYTITVTGSYQGNKIPVPGETVQARIVEVPGGAKGVVFVNSNDPTDTRTIIRIQTNAKGEASIGDGQDSEGQVPEWYIQSPRIGQLTVEFEVIDDQTADVVVLNLKPAVTAS